MINISFEVGAIIAMMMIIEVCGKIKSIMKFIKTFEYPAIGIMEMSPQQKLKRVDELAKAVQQIAFARIRQEFGGLFEREQKLQLVSLWLEKETMIKVFG